MVDSVSGKPVDRIGPEDLRPWRVVGRPDPRLSACEAQAQFIRSLASQPVQFPQIWALTFGLSGADGVALTSASHPTPPTHRCTPELARAIRLPGASSGCPGMAAHRVYWLGDGE